MRYDIGDKAFTVSTSDEYHAVILDFFSRLENNERNSEIFRGFLEDLGNTIADNAPFQVQVVSGWR